MFSHTQPREKSFPRDSRDDRDDRDDIFATASEVVTAVTVVTLVAAPAKEKVSVQRGCGGSHSGCHIRTGVYLHGH